jgi:predicted O-linked N-acetylglucosamine transferase (SPINDLY family)
VADVPAADGALRAALQAPEALHRAGSLEQALEGYAAVARAFPAEAEPHFRVGLVEAQRGDFTLARAALERALAIAERPHFLFALGDVLERQGERAAAIDAWRRSLALNPSLAEAHARAGEALQEEGRVDEAIGHFSAFASLRPGAARAWNNLAVALLARDRAAEAEAALRRTLALEPAHALAHFNLGRALVSQGREPEARPALEEAARLDPANARAWDMLGSLHLRAGALLDARDAFERAVGADPGLAIAWVHLGTFRTHVGLADEAVEAFRRAEEPVPADAAQIGSTRLFALQYSGTHGRDEVFEAHREWAARYAPAPSPRPDFRNPRDPERRLRIGYLSPRFHRASVAFLHVPVLENHDRAAFEIHCYAEQDIEDDVTARIRATGARWTDTRGLDDAALAARLRGDGIDIAIDLAGHTPGHRLTALAHGPAPLVGTWLDYFNTTGLACVDFLLTDAVHSPPGDGQRFTERLVRLPHCRYCWEPPAYAPEVTPPPACSGRAPVFGSFNRMAKISRATLDAWCALLARVPQSQLVIKNSALGREAERDYFARAFGERGIDPSRVQWRGLSDHDAMLAEYGDIDVVLDTFPYNGGLTTLEALWMGRPVVAVDGDTIISRQSKAILGAAGLAGLCAADAAGYVSVAEGLARDPARLAELSAGMRSRLRASPLLDAAGFTRDLEQALRGEWRRWCAAGR